MDDVQPAQRGTDHDAKRDYVGICVDSSRYGQHIALGAVAVLNSESTLRPLIHEQSHFADAPFSSRYVGLIGTVRGRRLREMAAESGTPLVNVSSAGAGLDLPSVVPDDRAIGRLAADLLLRRGYRHLLGVSMGSEYFERERLAGFATLASDRSAAYHQIATARSDSDAIDLLADRLVGIPPPFGVLAANDRRARLVLAAVEQVGWAVPSEVAVVGVDDDELICCMQRPTLSSIDPDGRRVGALAAGVLLDLLAGRAGPSQPIVVSPLAVHERTSTDAIVINDHVVAEALRAIDAEPAQGVESIAAALHIGRRALERRFRFAGVGTVRDAIRDARLGRARRLLADPDLSVERVADRLGYKSGRAFAAAFVKATGMTPTAWRELHRPR